MQIVSNDKAIRKNTVQVLKDFNSQMPATQARKREQIVSMTPAFKKAFDLMADDTVELSTDNESLKQKALTMKKK